MLVLYGKDSQEFESLGLGVLRDFKSDPITTEVLNGLYNLEFDYVKEGWLSEYLVEGNIVKADGQLFRIRSVSKDINDTKITIFAKHIWFDNEFNNWIEDVAPTNKTGHLALKWLLDNAKEPNKFNISGDCTKFESARYVRMNPIDAIYTADNAILNRFGGELEINNFNITLHNHRGSNTGLQIRQKKNLTGAKYNVDLSTLATRIMPVGNDGLLLPEKYIDSPLINNYYAPFYYKLDVDIGVNEQEGITLEDCYTKMRQSALELFDLGIDKPSVTISIDFIELSKTKEYIQYSSLETAHLGDSCKVYIPGLNINLTTRIVKIIKNLNNNRITNIELGTPKVDYVTSNSKSTKEMQNIVSKISPSSILEKARETATDLINHPFNGFLFISKNTGELYIMDTDDVSTAQNIWKFGLGGIGFSSTGISGPYTIAITQDGKIVADFITSGHLNANVINGGTLSGVIISGNEIIGGKLNINDNFIVNQNGKATMKNAELIGGNIELIDDGTDSEHALIIYNEDNIVERRNNFSVGTDYSGKTITIEIPDNLATNTTSGSGDGIVLANFQNATIYYEHVNADSPYYIYFECNGDITTIYDSMPTLWGDPPTNLHELTLPDVGNLLSINQNIIITSDTEYQNESLMSAFWYEYTEILNDTKFNSNGVEIKDDDINTKYTGHGMTVTDEYGAKHFNENGIFYQTNRGSNYSEFSFSKNGLSLTKFINAIENYLRFDTDKANASQVYLECLINGNQKLKVDNNGVFAPNIQSGTCNLDFNYTNIDFGVTFARVPQVIITPHTTTSGVIAPKVTNVTTTGFTATLGGSGSYSVDCDWIAIMS